MELCGQYYQETHPAQNHQPITERFAHIVVARTFVECHLHSFSFHAAPLSAKFIMYALYSLSALRADIGDAVCINVLWW